MALENSIKAYELRKEDLIPFRGLESHANRVAHYTMQESVSVAEELHIWRNGITLAAYNSGMLVAPFSLSYHLLNYLGIQ